jgi:riboflavin kinase/FMN adenylyltransferase
VDVLAVIHFTRAVAETTAEEFVRGFLHQRLGVREVRVGLSFGFGHRREGGLALLERLGSELGFAVGGVEEVRVDGQRVSSTRIRRALLAGDVERAMAMLGRPYSMSGSIARGDRMGKRLGWPTANLDPDHELYPADGVYAGRILIPDFPAEFDCATNIGTRPTVYENYQRVVESHILDFDSEIYGQRVELRFFRRLREERRFPSVMELSAQIRRDVEATREYFAARRRLEEHADRVAGT